jgi:hypothetical protein
MMAFLLLSFLAQATDGNRLTYLDESDPYYVGRGFPKLSTPQWVGEDGVEAVVILAIDDMRGHEKWEAYLRPILERLKKIDGRAPVSIMTCTVDPNHPHLQKWLKEGLSLEIHTVDHPCPLLKGGDFAKAKSTYDRCVDLLNFIPNTKPVAFRMPCCDSLNTPSPRFFTEIFNKTTPHGNFLTIDSSVFTITTSRDPELPKDLTTDPDGTERFRKYLPFPSFVNTIEDYPYPYVIGRLCWEFPCIVPSDWEAQHLLTPNQPRTVADLKAALDAVVLKQGTFTLVFHPHGWIKAEQIVELVDHAVEKHGKKVKFLTFREAQERLDRNLLGGHPVRKPEDGSDNGMRLLDINNDGYLDVLGWDKTRIWSPKTRSWTVTPCPRGLTVWSQLRLGIVRKGGYPTAISPNSGAWTFDGSQWIEDSKLEVDAPGFDFRLIDVDGDGLCEAVVGRGPAAGVHAAREKWEPLPYSLPQGVPLWAEDGGDRGLRFVDLNGDGKLDLVLSNDDQWGVYLFKDPRTGWERVAGGPRSAAGAIPMFVREGTNNGAWFHSRRLWVQNEDTAGLPDLVDRRSFEELLEKR